MQVTAIAGSQVTLLNVNTGGSSSQAISGTVVANGSAVSAGGAQGPPGPTGAAGPTGPQGPTAVSTDTGNIATLGTDSKILVPQSTIWNMRLRSFNAIGNPTFEVDQINIGNAVANANSKIIDRWFVSKAGTMAVSAGQNFVAAGINLPGTNFAITHSFFRITLTTAEASLAAGDYLSILQNLEGTRWRELQNDVHSLQVLVRSSVANLIIGASLRDPGSTAHSLTNTLTLGAANTWTLLPLPNLSVWPSGNFVNTPGNLGYLLTITLASGATYMSPANGTWQNGSFLGAVGQSNFAASPVNSTFDIAFVQHEPGALCTAPIDCPFEDNYESCQRYFQKSVNYNSLPNNPSGGLISSTIPTNTGYVSGFAGYARAMAKSPTIATIYDGSNGTANAVYNNSTGAHVAVSSVPVSEKNIVYIALATAQTTGNFITFMYAVDFGW
jgi:hypothetical protein